MTRTGKPVFLAVMVMAVILLGVTTACRQGGRGGAGPAKSVDESCNGGWLRGINVRHERFRMKDGSLEAVLSANEMSLDDDGNFSMRTASLEASTTDGRKVIARAAHMVADSQGKQAAVLDGGVAIAVDDVELKTETARWQPDTGLIRGPGPVTIEGDNMSLKCGRFVVTVENKALDVYDISGYINLVEKKTVSGDEQK